MVEHSLVNAIENERSTSDGYGSKLYVESVDMGEPVRLAYSDGWLLRRPIEIQDERTEYDLVGSYPIFCCRWWEALAEDLDALGDSLVSVSLVTDPFGNYTEKDLKICFPDRCFPYKKHYITDLSRKPDRFVSNHHRRYAKRAFGHLEIELVENPISLLDDWLELYSNLVDRHSIAGPANFTPKSLEMQLRLPGMIAVVAYMGTKPVGIVIWYLTGNVAYYHLAAYSNLGYELRASFGLFFYSIETIRSKAEYLSLGGGSGLRVDDEDGLARFKSGWSTDTRDVYFCGRILNQSKYQQLCKRTHSIDVPDFFPAYRTVKL